MAIFLFQFTLPKKDIETLPNNILPGYTYCKYNSKTNTSTMSFPTFQELAVEAEFEDNRDSLDYLLSTLYLKGVVAKEEKGPWLK